MDTHPSYPPGETLTIRTLNVLFLCQHSDAPTCVIKETVEPDGFTVYVNSLTAPETEWVLSLCMGSTDKRCTGRIEQGKVKRPHHGAAMHAHLIQDRQQARQVGIDFVMRLAQEEMGNAYFFNLVSHHASALC